jgi:hypothetical protein
VDFFRPPALAQAIYLWAVPTEAQSFRRANLLLLEGSSFGKEESQDLELTDTQEIIVDVTVPFTGTVKIQKRK